MSTYLVFRIQQHKYAIDVHEVQAIEGLLAVKPLSFSPDYVTGVVDLRGSITPVIDLKKYFDVKEGPVEAETEPRILLVSGNGTPVGLLVDEANDVTEIEDAQIQPPKAIKGGVRKEFLTGVAALKGAAIGLLNLPAVLEPLVTHS